MDTNQNKNPIEQLPGLVEQVQSLLADARATLKTLSELEATSKPSDSLVKMFEQYTDKERQVAQVYGVFLAWESEEIPAYEKSEVVRALGLLKRANLIMQNVLRILKAKLDIPDPERDQMELQMQLQSMGVIHGGSH